ncbi:MAG: hpt [Nitrospirae bacterium]|nr:hpt [Nitrospirota bacterium]
MTQVNINAVSSFTINITQEVLMVVGKPFLTVEQIQNKNRELADRISNDYKGKNLLAVGILKGAFIFFSDIVRLIRVPLYIDFLVVSSYLKSESSGEIIMHSDVREEIADKDVLLIEDIVDTGITLNYIRERILQKEPKSLKICTFLDKKARRQVDVPIDYVGFEIPDKFVVGYGLDYDNKFRNLPYISTFKKTT